MLEMFYDFDHMIYSGLTLKAQIYSFNALTYGPKLCFKFQQPQEEEEIL